MSELEDQILRNIGDALTKQLDADFEKALDELPTNPSGILTSVPKRPEGSV